MTAEFVKNEIEKARIDGRHEAWDCAREILNMSKPELERAGFHVNRNQKATVSRRSSIFDYNATEAINKLKQWHEEQDRIVVGDEVYLLDPRHKCVVTATSDTAAMLISAEGKWSEIELSILHKTGKHYNIQSILDELRG